MKELRQIKLALIDSDFMTKRVIDILSTLDETLGGLEQYKNNRYPNSIFYGKAENDMRIRYVSFKSENKYFLWIDSSKVWIVFETKFNLNDTEIQSLINWYIMRIYKINTIPNPSKRLG